jgi:membrane fusion protein (multidrug efflux system)
VPILLLAFGAWWWLAGADSASTDNAYVKQDIVAVAPEVSGAIIEVFVKENQQVNRGDVIARIDPSTAEVTLLQAEAQLAAAQLQTRQLVVQEAGTGADIRGAEATLTIARRALGRQQKLLNDGFTTRTRYDDALGAVRDAETDLATARARANNASAAIAPGGNQPAIAAANAAIAKARLDLKRGIIRAPASGTVAKADRLLVGEAAVVGLPLLSIVRDQNAWVEANFKEGELDRMVPGQRATVKFDAYPDLKLAAHVGSIGSGTGSEFSILPAQNANGNWVKVTQRVPVRILFDKAPPRTMIAGLSAKVDVDLETGR